MKYSEEIVNNICELIAKDSYTIAEICKYVNISERVYYKWQKENTQFTEAIKEAQNKYDQLIVKTAKKSLIKLIEGYTVDETKTIYSVGQDGKPFIREKTVVKKHYAPSVAATIFLLTNKASDEYRNKQYNELTGRDGGSLNQQIIVQSQQAADDVKSLFE